MNIQIKHTNLETPIQILTFTIHLKQTKRTQFIIFAPFEPQIVNAEYFY